MSEPSTARSGELAADQRILELAGDHLRRFGPRRSTIVGIAEAAGMSHANVYRYFPSKQALFEAVTALWLKPLEAQLRLIVEGQDPAYDKLERALAALQRAYREKLDRDPILFRLLCEAIENGHGVARRHRNRVQNEIQAIVEEGIGSGSFRMNDRRRAMALVFDLAHRFIQPVSIALDKNVSAAELEFRASRVITVIQRSLTFGDPDFDI
ncbi:TetR/AcrR family transcriptional regulator [uncultured Rhodoblastus sp.]|uniref:TetR/AcrR family transcriptional regulator n=1 Tax=uncultured Rhodoblastus sp. TaxID=543037 RepID=UPI0025F7B53E|nr:TetR/AcrR family transcriptional regulator [uncultured Rhodoblastus sp.]